MAILDYSDDLLVKHWVTSHFLDTNFYKLVYNFFCLCLCKAKAAIQKKAETYFTFVWFGLGWYLVAVLKVLCFWCILCEVIRNKGFFSYSRNNLLGIATDLKETSANVYSQLSVIKH